MKRFCIIAVMLMAVGSASAQKKEVATLQQQVAALTNTIDSLKLIIENDKLAIKALETKNQQIEATNKQTIKELEASNKQMSEKLDAVIAAYNQSTALVTNLTQQVTELNKLANERLATEPVPTKTSKAKYEIVGEEACRMIMVREGTRYGFINSDNEYIIKAQYEEAYRFGNGYAQVKKNGKWGGVNTKGKEVITCNYDYPPFLYNNSVFVVKKGNLQGLISAINGTIIQPIKYTGIYRYAGGEELFSIPSNSDVGHADIISRPVIKNRRCLMEINGKYGYFNEKGEVAIPAQYDDAGHFNNSRAWVKKGGRAYYIDTNGKEVK